MKIIQSDSFHGYIPGFKSRDLNCCHAKEWYKKAYDETRGVFKNPAKKYVIDQLPKVPRELAQLGDRDTWSDWANDVSDRFARKRNGGVGGGGGGDGYPSIPSFIFNFEPIEFRPVEIDFVAEYEKIRGINEGLVNKYSGESAREAQSLSRDFTQTNLDNFEMAMERIQPGYRGLMSKQTEIANSWLLGQVPEDVQNQLMIQASSRANSSGIGAGGFARNLLARDFGKTSLDLQSAGMGAASQLVDSARQTSRSLVADPAPLYSANFQAKLSANMWTPGQYIGQVANQAQFNSSGQMSADSANLGASMQVQQMQYGAAMAQYQDQLNKYALDQQRAAQNAPSGVFGKLFGNEIGSILDPLSSFAVPLIATVATGGNVAAGAAAGAAWGGLQAQQTGGNIGQGALSGGIQGALTSYSFGKPVTAWWQGLGGSSASAAASTTNTYGVLASQAGPTPAPYAANLYRPPIDYSQMSGNFVPYR